MQIFNQKRYIKFYSFLLIGILNNVANLLVFNFFYNIIKFKVFLSAWFGFFTGLTISYYLNTKYTFNSGKRYKKQFILFLVSQIIILNIFSFLVFVLNKFFILSPNIAWMLSLIPISILNFSTQKKILGK